MQGGTSSDGNAPAPSSSTVDHLQQAPAHSFFSSEAEASFAQAQVLHEQARRADDFSLEARLQLVTRSREMLEGVIARVR